MDSAREWSRRVASALAMVAALALLATVLAWWGWRVLGPDPIRIPIAAPADPVATILASGLFAASGAADPPTPTTKDESPPAVGDVRLLGVVAEADGSGYAVVKLTTGTKIVRSGQEIAQGIELVGVKTDSVTIREGGSERRILLRPADRPAPMKSGTVVAKSSPRSAACAIPAGFTGAVLRLNAELFQGIIAKPESWTALVVPERGALAVREDSGLVAMLAMKKSDRLEQANGIPLTAADDVVSAVLKPLAANQPVRVSGRRDGAPREWLLLNAGACPG